MMRLRNIYEELGVPELDPAYELIQQQRKDRTIREAAWAQGKREPDPHCPHCGEPGHLVACDECYKEFGAG